jgi:valyl-tRNA synthetase
MIMMTLQFTGRVPFRLHPRSPARDVNGKRMSKSGGNVLGSVDSTTFSQPDRWITGELQRAWRLAVELRLQAEYRLDAVVYAIIPFCLGFEYAN